MRTKYKKAKYISLVLLVCAFSIVLYQNVFLTTIGQIKSGQRYSLGSNYLENVTVIINCTLPKAYFMNTYSVQQVPITEAEAKSFVSLFSPADSYHIDQVFPSEFLIRVEGQTFDFIGKNHILGFRNIDTFVGDWDEEEVLELAEEYKDKIMGTFPKSPVQVKFDCFQVGSSSTSHGVTRINTIRAKYSLWVDGYEIIGNGADFCFDIADDMVQGFEVHYPKLVKDKTIKAPSFSVETLAQLKSKFRVSGVLDKLDNAEDYSVSMVVNDVDLNYYYDFLSVNSDRTDIVYTISKLYKIL